MNDTLDRSIRSVLADIVAATPALEPHPVHLVPLRPESPTRRPTFAIAAAVLAVAGLGLGLFAMSRQDSAPPAVDSAPSDSAQFDPLLYPAGFTVTQAYGMASPGNRASAVLIAPDGRPFAVNVTENFWGSLPADAAQREVNGRTFGATTEMGSASYTTVSTCLMVSVAERVPTATEWSADALTAVNALTINGTSVTLRTPSGWTSMGSHALGNSFSVSFTTSDGRPANLTQMLDAPAGALLAQRTLSTLTTSSFDGQVAWFYEDGGWSYMTWNRPEGSAVLGLQGGTQEQMLALAAQMSTHHGSEWSKGVQHPDESVVTVGTGVVTPGQCAVRTLTVLP